MALDHHRAGSDRGATVLREDGAQVTLVSDVADLHHRSGFEAGREGSDKIGGSHVSKIAAGRGVALLKLGGEITITGNRAGIDDNRRALEALNVDCR